MLAVFCWCIIKRHVCLLIYSATVKCGLLVHWYHVCIKTKCFKMYTASSIALLLGEYCTQTFQLVQNTACTGSDTTLKIWYELLLILYAHLINTQLYTVSVTTYKTVSSEFTNPVPNMQTLIMSQSSTGTVVNWMSERCRKLSAHSHSFSFLWTLLDVIT